MKKEQNISHDHKIQQNASSLIEKQPKTKAVDFILIDSDNSQFWLADHLSYSPAILLFVSKEAMSFLDEIIDMIKKNALENSSIIIISDTFSKTEATLISKSLQGHKTLIDPDFTISQKYHSLLGNNEIFNPSLHLPAMYAINTEGDIVECFAPIRLTV
ncbi:hypothetical protein [Aureibacter tunicatorum]|uniref:Peroxiredoxin n=1 Tax=Aureibacter tunicatorum TaxID=866807 RepID=A0AAE3XKB8_9BACT|nr:hypothetical protein [Aureibacter tunicatorum]MDR6237584.1 peroxiredoxin [Aureibacter tunicatorum]BDD02618.1 hypothetical protein AUTU_01010 [Aureibacter tunicatorum]